MDIITAIASSKLGKYQKQIDKCNHKNGCDSKCSKAERESCGLLWQHAKEMDRVHQMMYE